MSRYSLRALRLACSALLPLTLAACEEKATLDSMRSRAPIPSSTLSLMEQKGTSAASPILIRAYKKEAELEIWKMRPDGEFIRLKTFPMCRWSGQLGPKTREGDRQVPEGFYTITPGQMNPASQYYLSFNVGYPNAYDQIHGYSGGQIMVHGACSSAGCFSMTDSAIAEIYAIAREAFVGGQRAIQMQSYPFRMTPDNMAKFRLDPHMDFWKELKEGADLFEISHREISVGVCRTKYTFGLGVSPPSLCSSNGLDPAITKAWEEKRNQDEARIASLSQGLTPVRLVYQDGGQHPDFLGKVKDVSRPEALTQGPVEMTIETKPATGSAPSPQANKPLDMQPTAAITPGATKVPPLPPASPNKQGKAQAANTQY